MSSEVERLLAAVRDVLPPGLWSRGVALHREGAVLFEESDDGFLFRVAPKGGLLAEAVSLFPAEEDWECTCRSRLEACEHVAAAVIALHRAGDSPVPRAGAPGRVAYRLRSEAGGAIRLHRVAVGPATEEAIEASLAALARGRADGPRVAATPVDLEIEHCLASLAGRERTLLPWHRLLPLLERCSDVQLDGQAIEVDKTPLMPHIVVEDHSTGGFVLRLRAARVERELGRSLVIADGKLRLRGEPGLTLREVEELGRGRVIPQHRVGELVTEILPDLRRRLEVEITTERLPRTAALPPRVVIDARREDGGLRLRPEIVYGQPPSGRIEQGRLVYLGRGEVPRRDREREGVLRARLGRLGLRPGEEMRVKGERAVALARQLAHLPFTLEGEALDTFFLAPPVVPRLTVDGLRLEVEFVTGEDAPGAPRGSRAAAEEVRGAWRRGDSLVSLRDGGWSPLPVAWLARFGETLADLLAARDDAGTVPPACTGALAELLRGADGDETEVEVRSPVEDLLAASQEPPPEALPDDLSATLRDYQLEGVRWLQRLQRAAVGGLLADDMGLGKTLQALCVVEAPALVVCPTSLLHNWAQEAARFRPGLSVTIYHGPRRKLDPAADLTLTSYAVARLDAETLAAVRWKVLILDEAQAIKNPDSQAARAVCSLPADFRLALTGTPVENRLEELWSQLHFANPRMLGPRRDFLERYARPIAAGDEATAERLRRRIRPFILRRVKAQVAPELPARSEIELYCTLGEEERELYAALELATRQEVVARLRQGGSVMAALEALLRLRQAACHPALVPGATARRSAKMELLIERLLIAAADGHRSLVFSQWTGLLDLVEPLLGQADLDFVRLDGSTRDRAAVVDTFQREQGPPVMLVSLKAGGTGLNLTAADHVFLLDPWWNPAVEDQAADRTHRIGQQRPVLIHRLIAQDTVEERILALQRAKRRLADAILDGTGSAAGLSRDDLLALLE